MKGEVWVHVVGCELPMRRKAGICLIKWWHIAKIYVCHDPYTITWVSYQIHVYYSLEDFKLEKNIFKN